MRKLGWVAAIAAFVVMVGALASLGIEPEPEPGSQQAASGGAKATDGAAAREGTTEAKGTTRDAKLPPIDEMAARVEKLRGLRFDERPQVRLVAAKDLDGVLKRVDADKREALAHDARERAERLAAASQILTVASGVVDETMLQREGSEIEGVLGLYVPEDGNVYVVRELAEKAPAEAEAVLAHELAHALEDQNFGGFQRKTDQFADSAFARHALHEGSATLTEVMYRIEHQGVKGPVDRVLAGVRRQTTDPKAPPGLNVLGSFPYADGGRFAAQLHREGGWRGVNAAHDRPPRTTAAVLHPEAWPEDRHERPTFSLAQAMDDDWLRLGRADVGEVDTLAMLSAGLPAAPARRGAAGWEAGSFEAWAEKSISDKCKPPCRDKTAAVVVWKFADEAQQKEFTAAIKASVAKATGAEVSEQGLRIDDGAAAQVARGRVSSLAFAPSERQAVELATVALR